MFEKITAVIVYTESLSGLMFSDFRWIWTRNERNLPHFGIVGMHIIDNIIFETTSMNPYDMRRHPCLIAYLNDSSHFSHLSQIVNDHILIDGKNGNSRH